MRDVIYASLIEDMTWSYSRVKSFEDCKYRWFMKYILDIKGTETFFSSYGKFMHELIDAHYKNGLSSGQLQLRYLNSFLDKVAMPAPSKKTFQNYFQSGLQYLGNFEPLPYRVIATEKKVGFDINGVPLVGIIDYIGEYDDGLVIVDNKSRALKPKSRRAKPTKSDVELDTYLRQLYLYAVAIEKEYGRTPSLLCFNCFRVGTLIECPFDTGAYEAAKQWFMDSVNEIMAESDFNPNIDWFKCKYLCECRDECEYFEMITR